MRVDFSAQILELDGTPVKIGGKELTLSSVACNSLLAVHEADAKMSGEDKAKRMKIALRVHDAGVQDIDVNDAVLLKMLIGRVYGPLVVGRAFDLLDDSSKSSPGGSGKSKQR